MNTGSYRSAMTRKPRELGDFKGWVTWMLNFSLRGSSYDSRQYLGTMDRYIGEWLYTTTLPLEVFTQGNVVADFI